MTLAHLWLAVQRLRLTPAFCPTLAQVRQLLPPDDEVDIHLAEVGGTPPGECTACDGSGHPAAGWCVWWRNDGTYREHTWCTTALPSLICEARADLGSRIGIELVSAESG